VRVALVSEHASPLAALGGVDAGGQNVHVAALARQLALLGAHVRVYTRRDAAASPRVVHSNGYEVVHVDAGPAAPMSKDELYPHMHEFAAELVRDWRRFRPDVAHAHFWMSGVACLEAAAHVGVPVVQTFHALGVVKRRHQGAADGSPEERLAEERRLALSTDHVIATCSDEARELEALGAARDRVSIVPCGVDLERFSPRGERWPRSGRTRLVAVSRLVERKGLDDVVRALAHIPGAELLVAGGPPAERLHHSAEAWRLHRVARAAGVEERFALLGALCQPQIPALLRSADVVVLVPWYEPFGIVPLEAMACGVPVVGSTVGGLLDTIGDGVTGCLVPPRDPAALAACVRSLLGDPARRSRMGHAGASRARSYDWRSVAAATLAAYGHVVETAAAPLSGVAT
jgi:glycosyltransferase involved in cell wall biosynthesis